MAVAGNPPDSSSRTDEFYEKMNGATRRRVAPLIFCDASYNQPMNSPIQGVFTAAVTPLKPDFSPDRAGLLQLLEFLASRGSHGALLLGTTGEGPSFSSDERLKVYQAAAEFKRLRPDFTILAGTGTPSLTETIALTRAAFDAGLDGVVVLPPYYYRSASEDGLYAWFCQVLDRAVPNNGALLGYHIPPISGVALPHSLLARLLEAFPGRFAGIKDSSGDPEHARRLGETFGPHLKVMNGNDKLFSLALESSAAGCITALSNLVSPALRQVWDSYQSGSPDAAAQARLAAARAVSDSRPPAPALLKGLLSQLFHLPRWPVRPPLLDLPDAVIEQAASELSGLV
jgi:4-hydroxy-tetrahydrodipicolinate synthase